MNLRSLRTHMRPFLSLGLWVYLASLLAPLAVYKLALKYASFTSTHESPGLLDTLGLLRSDMLFGVGFALLWVGVFSVLRRGCLRRVATLGLHVSAVLIVVLSTCAYQYFETAGSTLDHQIVSFYLTSLGEVRGAISSETSAYVWLMLAAALVYAVIGPWLVTKLLTRLFTNPVQRVPGWTHPATRLR